MLTLQSMANPAVDSVHSILFYILFSVPSHIPSSFYVIFHIFCFVCHVRNLCVCTLFYMLSSVIVYVQLCFILQSILCFVSVSFYVYLAYLYIVCQVSYLILYLTHSVLLRLLRLSMATTTTTFTVMTTVD